MIFYGKNARQAKTTRARHYHCLFPVAWSVSTTPVYSRIYTEMVTHLSHRESGGSPGIVQLCISRVHRVYRMPVVGIIRTRQDLQYDSVVRLIASNNELWIIQVDVSGRSRRGCFPLRNGPTAGIFDGRSHKDMGRRVEMNSELRRIIQVGPWDRVSNSPVRINS